jgi:hypothetical protein
MEWEYLAHELQALGYFRYLTEERKQRIPKLLEQLKKDPSIYTVKVNRDYPADEERLTECGIKTFLKDIRPVLKANGVDVTQRQIIEDCTRGGYSIHVKGKPYLIYSAEELDSDDVWGISGRRTFAMINDLLRNSDAEERIYSYYNGNDHWAWFFTPKLHALLASADFLPSDHPLILYEDLS